MYRLRSIDVWDTLLRRNCHPEAVKLATAKHIYLRFYDHLRPEITDHWRIYHQRSEIEAELAREAETIGNDGEYEITQVLDRLLSTIASVDQRQDAAIECAGFELDFEISNTFADTGIRDFLVTQPAERTIFLSDFYMGSQMLRRLLAHHGLDTLVPEGMVSCDVMRNKRSGRLFSIVQEKYAVRPHEHVHIGDNPHADVEIPGQLGIRAVSYSPETPHAARKEREAIFASRNAFFDHIRQVTHRVAADNDKSLGSDERAAFQLGIQAAPLFIGFALFIAERSVRDKLDKLFFATREGEFFHRIYSAMFPNSQIAGCALPLSALLCVSRQSTFAASLSSINADELDRIWSLQKRQKLLTLFCILGVDPNPIIPLLQKLELSLDETILDPKRDARVLALLASKEFATAAQQGVSERKEPLDAYLLQTGFSAGSKVGLVDIGWRGTIQDNIGLIRPDIKIHGYYLALRTFLNEQPANVHKSSFGPDERIENAPSFFETFEPLELLCASPHGSVTGYRAEQDGIAPIRERNEEENAVFEHFTRHFQDGVILAAKIQAPLLETHGVMSAEMRDMALRIWSQLAASPPSQLVGAYYAAPQHDVFDVGAFLARDRAPSLAMLTKAVILRKQRSDVIQYIRRTQWSPAIDGLPVGQLNKLALRVTFWLAHRYKRIFLN